MELKVSDFKRVELKDRDFLLPRLTDSKEVSCEFNFSNLYVWGFSYHSCWQEFNGKIYIFLKDEDELLFVEEVSKNNAPSVTELVHVSNAMRSAGFSGAFMQVREEYVDAHRAELESFFEITPEKESFREYIYSVESLATLHGSKLSKKRNLISQFERDYPLHSIRKIAPSNLADCIKLSETWRNSQPDPNTLELLHEADALKHVAMHYFELDMDGLAAYVEDKLVAYAMVSRINAETFTEPFEKAYHEYKGAAQYINRETAKSLLGKCKYLNREQDLGMEGLRHAKMSYDPLYLLCNYRLTPK